MPVYQYPECERCEHVGTKAQCDVCYVDAFHRAEKRIAELESRLAKITADWERLEAENVELNMQLAQYKIALELAVNDMYDADDIRYTGQDVQDYLDRAKKQPCQEPK